MNPQKKFIAAPGGIIPNPGNTADRQTGDWRVERPVIDMERCTHCMICWIYCPDSAIVAKEVDSSNLTSSTAKDVEYVPKNARQTALI